MRNETNTHHATSVGTIASASFRVAAGREAVLFGHLRDRLYTNKVLAVLREYAANAWDAHRAAGIGDRPIKVTLPTAMDPTLVIRDYGSGLTPEEVFDIYPAYGMSTKAESDDQIGAYGIGSKSAFAYTNVFSIIAICKGVRSVYTAYLDDSGVGCVDLVFSEPHSGESGMEIRLAVNEQDIPAFVREAQYLFPHFRPLPVINIPMEPFEYTGAPWGFLRPGDESGWIAVMGGIPYRLDFTKMHDETVSARLDAVLASIGGGLLFDIGEVSVGLAREELEYTPATKTMVMRKITALCDHMLADLNRTLDDPLASPWQKRLATTKFYDATHLGVATAHTRWAAPQVTLTNTTQVQVQVADGDGNVSRSASPKSASPKSFSLLGLPASAVIGYSTISDAQSTIAVHPQTRLLVMTNRPRNSIWAYMESKNDVIVLGQPGFDLATVYAELAQWLQGSDATGVPVEDAVRVHNLRTKSNGGGANIKHTARRFLLNVPAGRSPQSTASANWDIVTVEPSPGDVFVLLSYFQAVDDGSFYLQLRQARERLEQLGGEWPRIYGVKTTQRHPVAESAVLGTPYRQWYPAEMRRLLANRPDIHEKLQAYAWSKSSLAHNEWGRPKGWDGSAVLEYMRTNLVQDHPLTRVLEQYQAAREVPVDTSFMSYIYPFTDPSRLNVAPQLAALQTRYPLLDTQAGFGVLRQITSLPAYLEYVRLVDKERPL